MSLSYIAVDINTGSIIADLPDAIFQGAMPQTLMRYESQTAEIPLDSAPSNWLTATRPGSAAIICLSGDAVTPLWGGHITTRTTDETGNITVSLATAEAYLDRVYVGDEKFLATDQNTIIQNLVTKYIARPGGIPIRVQIVGPAGTVRDRAYADTDDKTIYSLLGELSGVVGGPEWTIGWEYAAGLYTPVLYVGNRIGADITAGLGPNVVFNMPGPVTKASLVESFAAGAGANTVIATSTGMGGARPQSVPQVPVTGTNGRPIYEYRFSPATQITVTDTLTSHAQRALASMQNGSTALTIQASRQEAPRLSRDWSLGDTIGFDLTSAAWPDGIQGNARAIGWQLDDNTIVPILDASTIGGLDGMSGNPRPFASKPVSIYPGTTSFPSTTTYPA
jgi:hypothetical protein